MSANNWAFYEKGIFENNDDDAVVNHAVLLVGYGVDDCTGEKYYKLRNSWGPGFGEGGEFVFPLLEATVINVNIRLNVPLSILTTPRLHQDQAH